MQGRSPHGERGLKCVSSLIHEKSFSRSPHGERGLKLTAVNLKYTIFLVALLTESVDWNNKLLEFIICAIKSLSSRRAGIEIPFEESSGMHFYVALLTESVDWNLLYNSFANNINRSLSSRRAWIEMQNRNVCDRRAFVALLTESVDWNFAHTKGNM